MTVWRRVLGPDVELELNYKYRRLLLLVGGVGGEIREVEFDPCAILVVQLMRRSTRHHQVAGWIKVALCVRRA